MIEAVTNQIISALKDIKEVNTIERYLGQLTNQEEPEILSSKLPIIYIDYIGSHHDGISRYLKFNLYFVHITHSNNIKYREKTQNEIAKILEKAENNLFYIQDSNIDIKQSKKIFDAKIEKGYLVIFTMQLEAQVSRQELLNNQNIL